MSSDILLSPMTLRDFGGIDFMGPDYFRLPEGVDRDTLTALIMSETAEQECVYPEPSTMATVVRAWSSARLAAWSRMLTALTEEYNPLHNYDRTETESADETEAEDITDAAQSSSTATEKVTGFNTNTLTDNSQNVVSGSASNTRDRAIARGKDRTLRAYGNIGVTTSAEMLAGELAIRTTDIYQIIADEFEQYFCLGTY